MKKIIVITASILMLTFPLLSCFPVLAATNDFIADGNITVSSVTFGSGTADMIIFDSSSSESWSFNSGTFTVTNPGSAFGIGSSDSTVKSVQATLSGSTVACAENSTAGTSYLTLPTTSGTYTIVPSTTTNCTSLCTTVTNAATYNSFPTCGAATCNSGYTLSGSGSSATCVSSGGGSTPSSPSYCSSVIYDDWQTTCVGGLQYRNVKSQSPSGCSLTTDQESQRKRACGQVATPTTTPAPIVITPSPVVGSVSGVSIMPGVPATDRLGNITVEQILDDAKIIFAGNVNQIIAFMGVARDLTAETSYDKAVVDKIVLGSTVSSQDRNKILDFIAYGTKSTKILGAGERGGAVNSFKAAFGKLPTTEANWGDVVKIANGRWPDQRSKEAEDRAKLNFRKIYLRDVNTSNVRDNAAITVMAYGLRPANRNMNSEKNAIKTFKAIYGYNPEKATAWDVVRAIAYSGAIR